MTRQRDFSDPAEFDALLGELESYYAPTWSVYDAVIERVQRETTVCDFGCGTGRLARRLLEPGRVVEYVGHDRDRRRLDFARARSTRFAVFTADPDEFVARSAAAEHALFVAAFCLHDQPSLEQVLGLIGRINSDAIVVWDLTPNDLPQLAELLRTRAASTSLDPRLRTFEFEAALRASGRAVESNRQMHEVVFPTAAAVRDYVNAFSLLTGEDLGVVVPDQAGAVADLSRLTPPFRDRRDFIEVWARWPSP